jgi:hypothetical protein
VLFVAPWFDPAIICINGPERWQRVRFAASSSWYFR